MTLNNGTKKVSNEQIVKFTENPDFTIFPNPASDFVNVDLKQYSGKAVTIQLYNNFGTLISTKQVEKVSSQPFNLDINQVASGQYMIRVTSEGRKAAVKKFVIQN